MAVSDVLSILLGANPTATNQQDIAIASQESMAHMYESFAPFSLGTDSNNNNAKRSRKEIYSKWELMLKFSAIAEGMGIHVAAALGGDQQTSKQVFITPSKRLREAKGSAAKAQLKQLEDRIRPMEQLLNQHIVKISRDGVGFGDGYARVYGKKGEGITSMICNEYTYPPLIQAFEQGVKTVAFHALDPRNWQNVVTKLSTMQMVRFMMPRISHVPQRELVDGVNIARMLQGDDQDKLPIFPAHIGGSFLSDIESAFDNVILGLSAMNSQQIADAVKQEFLTINQSGMPPAQRKAYTDGLQTMFKEHEKFIKNALSGGEAIWNKKIHVLPTWDEKQILNSVGDLGGQRSLPINIETFMINVRLLMGGLGLDPSMVGWADMLSGGLGDGAAFHQSAQIMRRSMMVRQAAMKFCNDIVNMDWGYCYGEQFDPLDYPWQVEFYSDQSAAATEANANQQTRMSTLMLKMQAIAAIKETGLSEENVARLLERDGGMDYDEALSLAKDITKTEPSDQPVDGSDQPVDDNGEEI